MTLALTVPKRNKLDKRKKDGRKAREEEDEGKRPDGLFSVKKKTTTRSHLRGRAPGRHSRRGSRAGPPRPGSRWAQSSSRTTTPAREPRRP
jgi:hypothetical protein